MSTKEKEQGEKSVCGVVAIIKRILSASFACCMGGLCVELTLLHVVNIKLSVM